MILHVDPIAKPRMTRRDKWKQRPCVMRYRAFKDAVREQFSGELDGVLAVTFHLPMPPSWPRTKRDRMRGMPHQQKPDADNLVKGLLDALLVDDASVWHIDAQKLWADDGAVILRSPCP